MTKNNFLLSSSPEHAILAIAEITTDSKTLLKLMGLGLVAGQTIEVMKNRRGDIVLKVGNSRVSLGYSIARNIQVHKTEVPIMESMQ